jgi:hypothetical protein
MNKEMVVHQGTLHISGKEYEITVYNRDGRHFAQTVFAPDDVIISDGCTMDEALAKHQRLLPLAVNSRQILREFQGLVSPS